MGKQQRFSRRDFLKFGAVGAAGAAAAGIVGCTPSGGATDEAKAASPAMDGAINSSDAVLKLTDGMPKWSFMIPPEPVPDDQITETVENDIIVVGGGMSGFTTAVSAAEQGAKVTLFSAASAPISRGGSNYAKNSKVMEELGIEPFDPVPFYYHEMRAASFAVDQQKWMRGYNESEEAMNWMIDIARESGLQVIMERDNTFDLGPNYAHAFSTEGNSAMVSTGQQGAVEALEAKAQKLGVEIIYDTKAEQLIREDDNKGRVTGVIASKMADGSYVKFVAKQAVVLATGDFSQDKDMVAKYCPMALPFGYGGVYDGSGLKLALWIGASWQKYTPNAPMLATMGDEVLPCRWWAEGALTTFPGLLVNKKGVRYSNENCTYGYMPYPQRVQPDGCAFLIWDENWVQDSAPWQSDRVGGEPRDTQEVYDAIQALFDPNTDWTTTDEYAGFDATMAENAVKADTLEELADGLGLPREEFLAQVERYNSYCETGLDDEFHKDKRFLLPVKQPPFYGIKNEPYTLCITGGLNTDIQMHVCDSQNDPIPGLYGVGTVVGDMYGDVYDYKVPGINLGGACTTFGYLLGKNLSAGKW